MFRSIIGNGITIINFIICLLVAFLLGFIISMVHAKSNKTNKNFLITLTILPMLVSVVIMLVNGNLGTSVAVLGAFSLIRFRSVPGNSKEIVSVFFSMAIGLAIGCGYIGYAIVFTLIVALVMYLLSVTKFGEKNEEKKLTIIVPEDLDYTDCFTDEFKEYLNSAVLEKAKTTNMGSLFELTYSIKLKDNTKEKEFLDKVRIKNGNLKVMISHALSNDTL